MESNELLQPLLLPPSGNTIPPAAATTFKLISSNSGILFRLLSVCFIGIISVWASSEASKGFSLTIINEAGETPAGRKFDLFYVSNDKATRIVLKASRFVEKVLYNGPGNSNTHPKKDVNHVILRLAGRNLANMAVVSHGGKKEFAINICPSVMQGENVDYAMASAVQRGMARIWLWDGEHSAPPALLEGMVEYISILAGFTPAPAPAPAMANNSFLSGSGQLCWMNKDPKAVAHFLNYCEAENKGFIQRLNQAMKHQWKEGALDAALGFPVEDLCASYGSKISMVKERRLWEFTVPVNLNAKKEQPKQRNPNFILRRRT